MRWGRIVSTDRTIDKVDSTMADIQEQTQLANEVSEAISTSAYNGVELDDVRPLFHYPTFALTSSSRSCIQEELRKELEEMEDETLNERLREAEHVPIHHPAGAARESLALSPSLGVHVLTADACFVFDSIRGACAQRRRRRRRRRTTRRRSSGSCNERWRCERVYMGRVVPDRPTRSAPAQVLVSPSRLYAAIYTYRRPHCRPPSSIQSSIPNYRLSLS